jgi:hypothetical protein
MSAAAANPVEDAIAARTAAQVARLDLLAEIGLGPDPAAGRRN